MLMQRVFCRAGWQRQIIDAPNKFRPKNFLLHHGQTTQPSTTLLRAYRNSAHSRSSIQTAPFENVITAGGGSVPPRNVVKALVFTGAFSIGSFMGATIMEYENTRNMMIQRARETKFPWIRRKTGEEAPWKKLKREILHYWDQLSPGEKVFAPLCAINLLVFGLWRVPALRQTMTTYFCSNPAGRAVCWPMFLSTFSHYSLFHIFANMYVLHSFSNAAVLSLGKEQFLAVYLSAGVFASLTSIVYKAAVSQAGLSIGASGAIMGILAYVCAQYPDTQLSILFLPMLTFSAGAAIKVIMGIDLVGCIMGWRIFDHAAHLGGALFGIGWAYFGSDLWQQRVGFLTMYHDWRKTK